MKRGVFALVVMVVLAGGSREAVSKRLVVDLSAEHLTTRTDITEEAGTYYLLAVPVPAAVAGRHVYGAYLEFHIDASVEGAADGVDPAPRLQVCALTQDMGQEFDSSRLRLDRRVTNVPIGASRRVRVDVTEDVREWIATPASNHGLAIGALTGARDGRFTLRSGVRGEGVVARLVVHCE
jgi:hypothetical protein